MCLNYKSEINLLGADAAVFKDLEERGGTDCKGVRLLAGRWCCLSFRRRCCCEADRLEFLEASPLELLGASRLVLLEVGATCVEGRLESRDERRSVLEAALRLIDRLLNVVCGVGSRICDDGVWRCILVLIHIAKRI